MKEYTQQSRSKSRTLENNPKASRQAPIDVILQQYTDQNIQRHAKDELIQGEFDTAQRKEIDEDKLLQGKLEDSPATKSEQLEEKPNNTGLPDNLKSGIENLSGYSMDDVRVHYNSSKPAQLQALAYTQGTDIHVTPGQEKYLPHEAWHVVQQMQKRVQPTMQMQGVNVNDNVGLEKEADMMGEMIIQMKKVKEIEDSTLFSYLGANPTPHMIESFKSRFAEFEIPEDKDEKQWIKECFNSFSIKEHIDKFILITDDSENYPYGGFLTYGPKPHGIGSKTLSDAGFRGMNCWGGIILAAYNADLITKDQVSKLDKGKESVDDGVIGLLRERERIDFKETTTVPAGYIISKGQSAMDHVVLSSGEGHGENLSVYHVNTDHAPSTITRGYTSLKDAFTNIPPQIFVTKPPWLV